MINNLFIILVLYKTSLEESKTIISLNELLDSPINLFVYDNSPIAQYDEEHFVYGKFKVQYYHDKRNLGLSKAYNYALNIAVKNKKEWLLLLDQDTAFTREYVIEISSLVVDNILNKVVAIMPKVISSEQRQMISPSKMLIGGICRPINISAGIHKAAISGINSGTILNVQYMESIGGFDLNYSLDMLDHWYFRKIHLDFKHVYILKSNIYQDLSVLSNFEKNVSFERYKQMLIAEKRFVGEDGFFSRLVFKIRLVLRVFKQLKYNDMRYFHFTIKQIFKK